MRSKLPKFKSAKEESDYWDDPQNVEKHMADAKPVNVDFSEARKRRGGKQQAGRGPHRLRKAAG